MLNKILNFKKIFLLFLIMSALTFSNDNVTENKEVNYQSKETGTEYFKVYDPWESMNRRIYYFNYYFDTYFFQPVVNTYTFITPDCLERGVTNFYANSKNVNVIVNSAAQGKVRKFMKSLGRFSINSILGLFGVIDVAGKLDMSMPYEDFGTTLSYYGVPNGPYLILPIFGPSNLKNTGALGMETVLLPTIHPYTLTESIDMSNNGISVLNAIDTRKNVKFKYYNMGTPFEYEYVRFMYNEYRKHLETEE
jgi:phospholipid-binding lipoprotein MlaA